MAETGLSLVVSKEMLANLQKADNAITNLATKSEQAKNRIVAAFTEMGDKGVGAFIRKLNEAQAKIASFNNIKVQGADFSQFTNNTTQAIDAINKLIATNNKLNSNKGDKKGVISALGDVKEWQNLQQQITQTEEKIKQLKRATDQYERTIKNIKEGKSGVIPAGATKEYQQNKETIQILQQQISLWRDRQQQIVNNNQAIQQQINFVNNLREYVKSLNSLPNQRSNATLQAMREFYREEEKQIQKNARLKEKEDAKVRREQERNAKATAKAEEQRIKQESRMRRREYERIISTQDIYTHAMNVAGVGTSNRNVTTINQAIRAIKMLEQARKNLSHTDADYSQKLKNLNIAISHHKKVLDNAAKSNEALQRKNKGLLNISEQLTRRLALVFSVSQISGYVSKLIQIRGEFELQQRSLQAILQDRDEANKLWQQTVDLAVKSPFRVKELVTYTKQLAAYRIETEKLHSTTKMLSDVSAGLGVDMQRLILAYGQVKAANYLRGTELRQFSEAGINILGELAKYFSELEGRAISVGDVFERVSKRMVAFSDVEEIFKRLTSEGGTFYRMQEIQSNTLKGMISNLKDSIDLMLNEIGLSNEGTIKGMVNMVKTLVDNWEEVAFQLKMVISLMASWKGAASLINIGMKELGATQLWFNNQTKTKIGVLLRDIQTMTLAEAKLFGLNKAQYVAAKSTMYLQVALKGLGKVFVSSIPFLLIAGLTSLVQWLTKSSRAAKQLKEDLDKIYNEDTTNLELQINAYERLIKQLKDVNKGSKEHERIVNKINSTYGEYLPYIVDEKTKYEQLALSIESVNLALTRKAKLNTYEKAIAKIYETTNKAIIDSEKLFEDNIKDLYRKRSDAKSLIGLIDDSKIDEIFSEIDRKVKEQGKRLDSSEITSIIEQILGVEIAINSEFANSINFLDAMDDRAKAILERHKGELQINKEINNLYKDNAESAKEARQAFEDLDKREAQALQEASKKTKWEQEAIKRDFAIQRIDLQVKYEGLDEGVAKMRKEALSKTSATINDINKKIEENVKTLGEKFANLIYITPTEAETGISQIAESTAGAYKAQKEIIKQQNALKDAGTVYDKDILENAEKTAAAYYYKLQLMGRLDLLEKEQNKEEKKELQLLNKQISALKEARQTFDSLREKFGIGEATSRTAKAFEDLFKELNMKDLTLGMSFDISGVMKVLSQLPNLAGDAGRIAIEKFNAELQGGLDVDAQALADTKLLREIENMFTGYEVSLELQKLNIPKDWAKEFFGVETFDLSDIRTKIESELQKEIGENRRKELEKDLEKVKEMEVKAQQERLKTYLQYARDAVGDRAKIKLEEMKKLQEIEKTFTKPEQQDVKQKAIAKVKADSQKDLNKLEWEEFQKSDTFIRLFSDLDSASSLLINHALEKLKEFKDEWKDMPLEDMRAIVSKIDELELALGKIKPFRGLKVLKEQIKKAQQEAVFADIEAQTFANKGDYAKAYEQELIFQQKRKKAADKQIADLETVIQLKEEGNKYDKLAINLNKNQQGLYNNSVESLKEMLATQRGISNDSQNQSDVMSANLAQIKAQVVYLQAQADAINTAQDMANNLYDAFKGLNEVLGGGDSIGVMFADMGMQMLNTVFQTIALQAQLNAAAVAAEGLGVALNSAMGVIGWIVMGVNLIVQGLTAIFNANDKRLSNQIETLTHDVEDLDRALAKLEDRIDNAFSLTGVSLGTKDAIKNLQEQINSYERMIKLEKDKKKTDFDAVRQYDNAIKDLQDRQKELEKEAVSSATSGILDSTRDAARQFVDAWYEAFDETGDGLQGLKDNFKEIMLDMIQQQASMSIAGNFLNRWKAQLDKYINADDLELTTKEASNWMRSVQEELPMLNEALQNYFTAMEQAGLDLSKTGEMSGLQRGIQSVTEETAQALEALLNSTRFFVADSNAKLTLLVDSFTNPESANPMLSELRSQTDLIRTIRDMFSSVIGRGDSTHSGAYLKVVM